MSKATTFSASFITGAVVGAGALFLVGCGNLGTQEDRCGAAAALLAAYRAAEAVATEPLSENERRLAAAAEAFIRVSCVPRPPAP